MSPLEKLPSLMDDESQAPQRAGGAKPPRSPGAGTGMPFTWKQGLLALLLVAGLGVLVYGVVNSWQSVRPTSPQWPQIRVMNPDTGELRWHQTGQGRTRPEGFHPVEYCFWNECGPAGGTPVVLNLSLGIDEPTQCPRCGRRVVGHNPRPAEYEGVRPADWDRR